MLFGWCDPSTLKGMGDRAILVLLVSCGLRRGELVASKLTVSSCAKAAGLFRSWWEKGTDFAL